jgi:hypothetical protein
MWAVAGDKKSDLPATKDERETNEAQRQAEKEPGMSRKQARPGETKASNVMKTALNDSDSVQCNL